VNSDVEKYLALLEKRLTLLRALAQQFVDCRGEFVSMNLDGMHKRIAEQQRLCEQIQLLHPTIGALRRACAVQLEAGQGEVVTSDRPAASAARLRDVMLAMSQAQQEVGRLNQIHAAYLRRSSKTIEVLLNFVGNYSLTYGCPVDSGGTAPRLKAKG
jgi:hypothetical protein